MSQFLIASLLLCFIVAAKGQSPPSKSDTDRSGSTVTVPGRRSPSPPRSSPSTRSPTPTRPPATAPVLTTNPIASTKEPSPSDEEFVYSDESKEALANTNSTLFKGSPVSYLAARRVSEGSPCQVNYGQKYGVSRKYMIRIIWLPKARLCCELCRVMSDCYSWWWQRKRCYLNKFRTYPTTCSFCAGGNI